MKIKRLNKSFSEEYVNLMVRAVGQQPESFRINVADVSGAPPFAVETDDNFTLGAFNESEKLIGVVSFAREKQEKLRHKGLIYRMYVASRSAGKGIGRALLRAAIERARTVHDLEQVNLTVVASNDRAKIFIEVKGLRLFRWKSGQ